jgi:hypothetical protein
LEYVQDILDFKLSPCSVFSVLSFGCFPGVCFILADGSEHSICSIFKADNLEVNNFQIICLEDGTECSETSANINQTPGTHPKDSTLNTEHGESLKSRISWT